MAHWFDERGQLLGAAEAETRTEALKKLLDQGIAERIARIEVREQSASVEMPRYKCHKEVWALQIASILQPPAAPTILGASHGSYYLGFAEASYAPREVSHEWVVKHAPQVGGYFVVYADGYESYSPREAFESGYTRI